MEGRIGGGGGFDGSRVWIDHAVVSQLLKSVVSGLSFEIVDITGRLHDFARLAGETPAASA